MLQLVKDRHQWRTERCLPQRGNGYEFTGRKPLIFVFLNCTERLCAVGDYDKLQQASMVQCLLMDGSGRWVEGIGTQDRNSPGLETGSGDIGCWSMGQQYMVQMMLRFVDDSIHGNNLGMTSNGCIWSTP